MLSCAWVFLMAACCQSHKAIPISSVKAEYPKGLLPLADTILIGTVIASDWEGAVLAVSTPDTGPFKARLQKLTVHVENTLRGIIAPGKEIVFYRYDCYEDCRLVAYRSFAPVGSRRIFFLRSDGGVLRSAVDIAESEIPVYSGQHSNDAHAPAQLEQQIAHLLLTPGSNFHADVFARGLFDTRYVSEVLIGHSGTLELVKPLLENRAQSIRIQACLVLAEFQFDYNGCLKKIISDPATPEARLRAVKGLQGIEESQRQLKSYFLSDDPTRWLRSTASSESPADILDLLKILAQNIDTAVQQKACDLILKSFPNEYRRNCK